MVPTEPESITFRYARAYFAQRFVLLTALLAGFIAVLGLQFSAPALWLVALAILAAVYLVIFGLSPLLTAHRITRSRLVLRQGWYFTFPIPLASVEAIAPFEGRAVLGLRARLGEGALYVAGSSQGLVEVTLPRTRRFWQVLGASARRIVFDVESRDAFLEAVAQRRRSLPPVQAERAYPELRD